MENSFFEFRNETMDVSMASACDSDVIDNSLIEDESFSLRKPGFKNQTVAVVAESAESNTDCSEDDEDAKTNKTSQNLRNSNVSHRSICSSNDGINEKINLRRQSNNTSHNHVALTSSSEGEGSPEMLPRRRPFRPKSIDNLKSSDNSFIGRRGKKVIALQDSDSDCDETSKHLLHENEIDEDEMVMSAVTRMSILGVRPKDMASDESDFIQSDSSSTRSSAKCSLSHAGSTNSLSELPEVEISTQRTPQKQTFDEKQNDNDTSRISCSTIGSPIHDMSVEFNNSIHIEANKNEPTRDSNEDRVWSLTDLTKENVPDVGDNKVQNSSMNHILKVDLTNPAMEDDDDVKLIDNKVEIIDISSDDDNYPKVERKSPKPEKSPKAQKLPKIKKSPKQNTLQPYLVPASYPNQVVYVKKHVRDNELNKLEALREDLQSVRYLLNNMDMKTLPDGGAKLVNRLSKLEEDIRKQGDKVAAMVVEPDNPTPEQIAKDGYSNSVPSWDDIKAGSNSVQPKMFGKQAMATHVAERAVIMERLRSLHASLASRPAEARLAAQPAALASALMPHQRHALAWLRWRETQRPRGGILADDMGLGKTITMIALVLSSKEDKIDEEDDDDDEDEWRGKENSKLTRGGTLVVCPASLLQQWEGEVRRHARAHALSLLLHHGSARAAAPHRLRADLVLTTYNLLQRDVDTNGVLTKIRWTRIVLDEAHIVRNHKSATSVAVSSLAAARRWCLTGTPVQNKDLDVFALLKFLRCTPFDDLTMWKKWMNNKSTGAEERLNMVMRCLMLRRTKVQLQQRGLLDCLPERAEHLVEVTFTDQEMSVYQKVLVFSKTLFAQYIAQRAEKQTDLAAFGSGNSGKDDVYAKMHKKMVALHGAKPIKSHEILVVFLRLRQVCCHCGLIAGMLTGDDHAEEDAGSVDLLQELKKMTLEDEVSNGRNSDKKDDDEEVEGTTAAEALRSVLSPNNPVFNMSKSSSKIDAVISCLEKNVFVNKGDKAVVVSQWTSVLALVAAALRARAVPAASLTGRVPVAQRAGLVDAFNDPASRVQVMLLSLCAGGVGLNLCGGNHLLLVDPHWNPQLEAQAQDRIYRVGQKKNVHIYKFLCKGSVEQHIKTLQEHKLKLADSVLTGAKNNSASKLTIEDLKMLFNMGHVDE